ncbi:Flp pilus assembly protein CpaB [Paraburkholderia sediminicola]|uniref:Flp pilus assembly protein CpaB n=1 Tax=Paraburkholderia sediminicola TaxID=458836 RepID=UPI0038B87B09
MPNLTRMAAGILIALAVLLGALAVTLARRTASVVPHPAQTHATFPVVVALHGLPAGQPIAADALRIQNLPINPAGAFADPAMIVGRVPIVDIGMQSPVLESQLSSGIAERLELGERAVAVRVDETNAVGNRLRAGNLIDVFFMVKRDGVGFGQSEVDRTQARLLLSRVRVLAYGNVTPVGTSDTNTPARTAVLAVPLVDVDRLTLAEGAGHLVLALRNPRDDDVLTSALPLGSGEFRTSHSEDARASIRAAEGVALNELSGCGARCTLKPPDNGMETAAARAHVVTGTRAGSRTIEVIRGGRSETVAW